MRVRACREVPHPHRATTDNESDMRLLQLNPDGTEESALDFHPTITVVNGLGVGGRDVVIRAITAIARGQDPGIGGLVEAHGVLFDLTKDTLSLLDVHTDLDVLLGRAHMPSPDTARRRGRDGADVGRAVLARDAGGRASRARHLASQPGRRGRGVGHPPRRRRAFAERPSTGRLAT